MCDNWQENRPCLAAPRPGAAPLFIMHIALQGCISSGGIRYGLTADTGGHIRYLLEEVAALQEAGCRQVVITRAFDDARLGREYAQPREILMPGVPLYRLGGADPGYLSKEELHRDLAALAASLERLLGRLARRPDIVHAHYADAGVLARRVKQRFGIPYLFTAHSLGAVKAQYLAQRASPRCAGDTTLARRIETEQHVIDDADRLIASSMNEVTEQYGRYRRDAAVTPAIVNPPGIARARFAEASPSPAIETMLSRFLARPDKPMLLCVARPVIKKNLAGVLDAYAGDAALRERANLVILAGSRERIADQEPECAGVLRSLLDGIERHDLYGHVALPKRHDADEVPGLYKRAAAIGGLFVNAAFNEPFGLTYIEAAAAGLPILASRYGGGAEILQRCQNGRLIDPFVPKSLVEAAHALLDDPAAWQACAEMGAARVSYFSWRRHARQYVRDCAALLAAPPPPAIRANES